MTAEFKILTVKIRAEDSEAVHKSLSAFVESAILNEEEVEVHPHQEEWESELEETLELINEAKDAAERLNGVSIQGYAAIWQTLSTSARFNDLGLRPEDFVATTHELFLCSLDQFKKSGPTKLYGSRPQSRYATIDGSLNPRDIRLVIERYGLSGRTMTYKEINEIEGIRGSEAACRTAVRRMLWCFEASSVENPQQI